MKETFTIRTLPVAAFVYANNFLKTEDVKILKVWTESFKSDISRTLATYKIEFFVTLAVGWKLAAKYIYIFLEHFKQDRYFDESNEK